MAGAMKLTPDERRFLAATPPWNREVGPNDEDWWNGYKELDVNINSFTDPFQVSSENCLKYMELFLSEVKEEVGESQQISAEMLARYAFRLHPELREP